MNKNFYTFLLSMMMMCGYLLGTTAIEEPGKVSHVSNLNLNIKCNPEQKISGIHHSRGTITQQSSSDQMEVTIQEQHGGGWLKVKVLIAATAVAGFCYAGAERVVTLASKIKKR